MIKWRLFSKSKETKETKPEEVIQENSEELTESDEEMDIKEDTEDMPLTEYHETLQTGKPRLKKYSISQETYESDQRIWRNVSLIEERIDKLHKTLAEKPITDIDKKVDRIIIDVEIDKKENHKKPANVIYVVNKPQPGQVRGDWAVRGHGKIYSHHRKKQTAIKAARKIAKEKGASVLVQNTDGTFSEGFKPR